MHGNKYPRDEAAAETKKNGKRIEEKKWSNHHSMVDRFFSVDFIQTK